MLDGTGKQLLDLLKQLDDSPTTYESLVNDARQAVSDAKDALDSLLALEGLCNATTLKTPSGRKRRSDRGKKRNGKNDAPATETTASTDTTETE